jgi:GNAT superfamily N-acetyltransferase
MAPTSVLRDAAPADAALLLRLLRELAEYEKLPHEVVATEAAFAAALFGPRPLAEALIAEAAGQPVGFSIWYFSFNSFNGTPCLYIEDVYVRQAHRGRGIGRAIFADLARRALARGCQRMQWSVLDWNAPSIEFYHRLGARPVRGWTVQRLTGEALAALAG